MMRDAGMLGVTSLLKFRNGALPDPAEPGKYIEGRIDELGSYGTALGPQPAEPSSSGQPSYAAQPSSRLQPQRQTQGASGTPGQGSSALFDAPAQAAFLAVLGRSICETCPDFSSDLHGTDAGLEAASAKVAIAQGGTREDVQQDEQVEQDVGDAEQHPPPTSAPPPSQHRAKPSSVSLFPGFFHALARRNHPPTSPDIQPPAPAPSSATSLDLPDSSAAAVAAAAVQDVVPGHASGGGEKAKGRAGGGLSMTRSAGSAAAPAGPLDSPTPASPLGAAPPTTTPTAAGLVADSKPPPPAAYPALKRLLLGNRQSGGLAGSPEQGGGGADADVLARFVDFHLLFSSSRDGYSADSFHAAVRSHAGPTLVVYREGGPTGGVPVAGYTTKGWAPSPGAKTAANTSFVRDDYAFLCKLHADGAKEMEFWPVLPHAVDSAVLHSKNFGPAFGRGPDLALLNVFNPQFAAHAWSSYGVPGDPPLLVKPAAPPSSPSPSPAPSAGPTGAEAVAAATRCRPSMESVRPMGQAARQQSARLLAGFLGGGPADPAPPAATSSSSTSRGAAGFDPRRSLHTPPPTSPHSSPVPLHTSHMLP
ncbi:hypothetical protein QJQ45_017132, partial [Haematococcus lacustris]